VFRAAVVYPGELSTNFSSESGKSGGLQELSMPGKTGGKCAEGSRNVMTLMFIQSGPRGTSHKKAQCFCGFLCFFVANSS
jgi:hypothetical protein